MWVMRSSLTHLYPSPVGTHMKPISWCSVLLWSCRVGEPVGAGRRGGMMGGWWFSQPHQGPALARVSLSPQAVLRSRSQSATHQTRPDGTPGGKKYEELGGWERETEADWPQNMQHEEEWRKATVEEVMGCELGSAGVHPTWWGFIYVSYESLLKTYANDIDRHLKFYVYHNVLLLLI